MQPFSRRIARSQQASAHSASWVMTIMVRPIFASLRIILLTFRIFVPSNPLVGSSSTIIGALCIKATPRASLCFCPPDSVEGCCLINGASSKAPKISSASFFRSGVTSAPVVSSSSKFSPKSWLSKSWGMYLFHFQDNLAGCRRRDFHILNLMQVRSSKPQCLDFLIS